MEYAPVISKMWSVSKLNQTSFRHDLSALSVKTFHFILFDRQLSYQKAILFELQGLSTINLDRS